jgi:hypothetical protein
MKGKKNEIYSFIGYYFFFSINIFDLLLILEL